MSTTIIIPGRETQVISGVTMSASDVIAAYSGTIDLSGMTSSEERTGDGITITFANRTGTKGNGLSAENITINVEGDVIVNTRIEMPGREAVVIPGQVLDAGEVIAAYTGTIDLSGYNHSEEHDGDTQVIRFANRTGTKGTTNLVDVIAQALATQAAQASQNTTPSVDLSKGFVAAPAYEESVDDDFVDDYEEEFEELVNTRIFIPGREAQFIPGMVMDATMVRDSFSGTLDLSGYTVEEVEVGDTLEVRFTARTGTKG